MKAFTSLTIAATAVLALAGCNGGSTSATPVATSKTTYTQIERLARPAVKEVFEKFVDHQTSNAAEPYNDPTLQAQIMGLTDALRPPNTTLGSDYGKKLAAILYPDEYTVDLSKAGPASYLGIETTGGTFGGRAVTDNVVDISLGAIFGHTLATIAAQPEDNEENNCLTTQNVAQNPSQAPTATFPYLPAPH
jgi:hypothetical protein